MTKKKLEHELLKPRKQGDLSVLLNDDLVTFYWLGFLMADGHFSKSGRLQILISDKDENHLLKLANFLKLTKLKERFIKSKRYVGFSVMDKCVMKTLTTRYEINNNKTENPCNISNLSEDELFCLSIGFIDGDGSIRKVSKRVHPFLSVKCHSSWLQNLKVMYPLAFTKINNFGYAQSNITDTSVLKALKIQALSYGLPILERKWNMVDLEFKSRQERIKEDLITIIPLVKNGISLTEICRITNYNYENLYMILKSRGLKCQTSFLPPTVISVTKES